MVENFSARPLLLDIFAAGKQVYELPSLLTIKQYTAAGLDGLWDEYKRSLNPQEYPVDLSQELYDSKVRLIEKIRHQIQERSQR